MCLENMNDVSKECEREGLEKEKVVEFDISKEPSVDKEVKCFFYIVGFATLVACIVFCFAKGYDVVDRIKLSGLSIVAVAVIGGLCCPFPGESEECKDE